MSPPKRAFLHFHLALNKIVVFLERKLQLVGGSFLVLMVLLTTANIVARKLGFPIKGTVELIGIFSALVISASLALTQSQGGHIAVNILTQHFPRVLQKVLGILNALLCAAFFIVLSKGLLHIAETFYHKNEITETLHLPLWPFVLFCSLGVLALALSLAVQVSAFFCDHYQIEYQGDKG